MDHPENTLTAKITQIDPTIHSDGSFKVLAQLQSNRTNLKKGMHIQAKISGTSESVFSLPKSSLVGSPDQPQLIKQLAENEFSLLDIELLKEDNERIFFQFKSTEANDSKFISQGAYDIYMEMLKE